MKNRMIDSIFTLFDAILEIELFELQIVMPLIDVALCPGIYVEDKLGHLD
jgi:hypothetical protein